MISVSNLCKTYRKGKVGVPALKELNLHVDKGEFLVLQGPSGSGKSTLLNIIGALDEPTFGRVEVLGRNLQQLSDRERAQMRGKVIGFVFQSFNLIPHLRAWENVALPLRYGNVRRRQRRQRALTALEWVRLSHRATHLPAELSGGEEQRVAIARALVIEPRLILADEPTGNLDTATGQEIMERFASLHDRGVTVIIATHNPQVAACAQRSVTLRDGSIQADTTQQLPED